MNAPEESQVKESVGKSLEPHFIEIVAREVGCRASQVVAADGLFAEGATVPFVARYRKEATGGLIDEQLETLAKRRDYFLELAARRDAVLASIAEQGKLTEELEAKIRAAVTKHELEDLYLPYKPKRRTRAQIAREKGLEPLADQLLAGAGGSQDPADLATAYLSEEKGVASVADALAGARDILAERLAESAEVRSRLRAVMQEEGILRVRVLAGKEQEGAVYRDYFAHDEPVKSIPSHRMLAVLRGERESFLVSELALDDEREGARAAASWGVPLGTPCGREVAAASEDGYVRLLRPSIANEVRSAVRERAEADAIGVFRANLEALLMQSPLGKVTVVGVDPGFRTGAKVAVVDPTGKVLATTVIYPVPPKAREEEAAATLVDLIRRHGAHAVAIGNGTASRETESFATKAVRDAELGSVVVAIVPETGASVYSASAEARSELPDLDVSLRGAVSIARRLQDPLAELVKIEPKSLGVGQYQHDVDQKALSGELDVAVETVVNRVGVELNTASISLLRRVSGLSERLARAIVSYRDQRGPYSSRQALLDISGFGPKTFEQAAGFLRLRDAANALDRTAVHPERYSVVERMAANLGMSLDELVGNPQAVARIDFGAFADAEAGLGRFTLEDIKAELERPGRDPRPEYVAPRWREDVRSIEDLQPGMTLEGRVSNVANFGAFVDVGVGRDGLVHVSELSHRFVADPRQAVKVGQVVKVQVLEVDRDRERINLSMKALEPAPAPKAGRSAFERPPQGPAEQRPRRDEGKPRAPQRPALAPPREQPRREAPPPKAAKPPERPATLEDLMAKYKRV
ncbi:MAG TPA: Tex family protein [Thermoanaerobaculia bacterium]|nr:Tex family protein [Thermoanaerobaculia bacterium]